MKRLVDCLIVICALFLFSASYAVANPRPGRTVSFNDGWRFHLGDVGSGQNLELDDSQWRLLNLPHDWSIEGEFNEKNPATPGGGALPGGIGWYRKIFSVPDNAKAKKVLVDFDGVYRNSEVWINGQYLGKRPYGYSSFQYDLTPYLHSRGRNVIAVRVDNSQQPNSRWYSGSGIYRHVRLVSTGPVHVDQWGTYVTTPTASADSARVTIRTTIRNARPADQAIALRTTMYDSAGKAVAVVSTTGRVPGDSVTELAQDLTIARPALWSLERPYLYRAVSRVVCGNGECDDYTTQFGVRSFVFRADSGFSLNGRPVKIRGVCLHHDLGALG